MRRIHVLTCGIALALSAATVPASLATASPTGTADVAAKVAPAAAPQAAKARRITYTPRKGALLNDPMVNRRKRVIQNHIIRSIQNTPKGQRIRIATWNFDDRASATALINAARRGVSVQVVVTPSVQNRQFTRLVKGLRKYSRGRYDATRSYAKRCRSSCRGRTGIVHTKIYLFSRSGRAKEVVMFGSANLTAAAGNRQWNDLITVPGSHQLYAQYVKIFTEMKRDRPVTPAWRVYQANHGAYTSHFFPATGVKPEPVIRQLNNVHCRGTTGGTGNRYHRTIIRIAIAGWFDEYGARIARKVRRLWEAGCDVKIVNTLTGRGINKALRATSGRGPVPNREVTIDNNRDRIPEKYLHLKYLTVNGNFGSDSSSRIVFTGSANWSQRSVNSDELMVRVKNSAFTLKYQNHVNRLFASRWAHGRISEPEALRPTNAFYRPLPGAVDVMKYIEQDW